MTALIPSRTEPDDCDSGRTVVLDDPGKSSVRGLAAGDSDASAVCQLMGDILHRVEERVAGATFSPASQLSSVDYVDDVPLASAKHRKKSRRHREEDKLREKKRKRSTSCSTASSTCSSVCTKKHKKKKKKHRREEDPPSPRVNPIFLWVKQDDTKIVEVLCEDYDKRNRITLTKTAAGWRAIPRTERLSRQSSYQLVNNPSRDTKDDELNEGEIPGGCAEDFGSEPLDRTADVETEREEEADMCTERVPSPHEEHHQCLPEVPTIDLCDDYSQDIEENDKEDQHLDDISHSHIGDHYEDIHKEKYEEEDMVDDHEMNVNCEDRLVTEGAGTESLHFSSSEETDSDCAILRDNSCEAEKCCEMNGELSNLDENHNNEYEDVGENAQAQGSCLLDKVKECTETNESVEQLYREVDECVEKGLKDLIDELDEHCMEKSEIDSSKMCNDAVDLESSLHCGNKGEFKYMHCVNGDTPYLGANDCDDLMEELEEMCHGMINQRLKTEETSKKEDLDDVYTFVPSPENETSKMTLQGYKHLTKEVSITESNPKPLEDTVEDKDTFESQYAESNSPMNLVIQDKDAKESDNKTPSIQTSKITDFETGLDILWRLPEGTTIQQAGKPINKREEAKPAHQQTRPKFPDILNIPQLRAINGVQEEPLDLGKSKLERKPSPLNEVKTLPTEPKTNLAKIENITLKKILNKQQNKPSPKTEINIDPKTKSKLLELLTSETMEDKQDPLAQLKEILSDPTLVVPDPLLVPRARLPALVANPAKEIPRLLSQKQEKMSYPKLDPDLLVVSLAHLQSLLQNNGKDEDLTRLYQHQAQMLQSQLKQDQGCLDAATANALNQMLWLPYLNQLEAAAAACGNNQEFLAMLNMVFPPYSYVQNPYMQQMPNQTYDYNSSLQQSQMLSAWQDMMQKPQLNSNFNNESSKKYDPYKMYLKPEKKASARTSPLPNKYQQQRHRNSHQVSNNTCNYDGSGIPRQNSHYGQRQSYSLEAQYLKQRVEQNPSYQQQRSADFYRQYSQGRETTQATDASKTNDYCKKSKQTSEMECLLRSAEYKKNPETQPSNQVVPGPDARKPEVPKLKVKEHLIDPNIRPKLLKFDDHMTSHAGQHIHDETHPHLWHPLFSRKRFESLTARIPARKFERTANSHEGKSYTSPWQWTTPVTVSGE